MTRRFVEVMAGLLAMGIANAGAGIAQEEQQYNRLYEAEQDTFDLPSRQRARAIEEKYGELFPRRTVDEIEEMKDGDLAFGFRAAFTALFYARSRPYLEVMSDHLSEMERRGIAQDQMREDFYRGLIGLRAFDEAAAYLSRHPGLQVEPVPAIAPAGSGADRGPMVYRTDPDEFKLLREHIRIDQGIAVVAVVHPLCNPSRRAMEAILKDVELLDAMKTSVHWVAPQSVRLNFDAVQDWNREHPDIQIGIAHDTHQWPGIDDWSTPHFYLLRDGALLDQFMGWPGEGGNRARLVELLERGELLRRTGATGPAMAGAGFSRPRFASGPAARTRPERSCS
ncbi:hypothetical protein QFW77_11335 [Luteimonas sp. RD2P54]|uniref:Thioredoxin domain-containing protein n=1 Tax=Luteimonas endophytica TaxID=3042023 RepID=A0ABT6JA04_9GAMM|nr:hypothetical protein [Luteimonas endophytica]MDH5823579.1 hypothetical protein [Luteimonas endophytica]